MTDKIKRFIFDTYGIRGELVELEDSCQRMLKGHNYPPFIATLLQQAAAVGVLLASTIKFEGKISIQLLTPEKIKMLVVQTTHQLGYRGLVRFDENVDFSEMSFEQLADDGQMSITIEPTKGKRYQGIVPLDGESLAQCVENYFNQSEQLDTRIWLYSDSRQVCGLMLQALPDMLSQESFEHLVYLCETLTEQECLSVDADVLLHRLFHQESIKSMSDEAVSFNCGCSEKKMLDSINLLPADEINDILLTKGQISVRCEFCLEQFQFGELDIKANTSIEGNTTKH